MRRGLQVLRKYWAPVGAARLTERCVTVVARNSAGGPPHEAAVFGFAFAVLIPALPPPPRFRRPTSTVPRSLLETGEHSTKSRKSAVRSLHCLAIRPKRLFGMSALPFPCDVFV